MPRRPDASPQTLLVLEALSEIPDAWHYGYYLSRRLGLRSGTLYPILVRLAERGSLRLQRSWRRASLPACHLISRSDRRRPWHPGRRTPILPADVRLTPLTTSNAATDTSRPPLPASSSRTTTGHQHLSAGWARLLNDRG